MFDSSSIIEELLNEDVNSRLAKLTQQFGLSADEILKLAEHDPTKDRDAIFVNWLCARYKDGTWNGEYPVKETLQFFKENKHKYPVEKRDINKFKNILELENFVREEKDKVDANAGKLINRAGNLEMYTEPNAAAARKFALWGATDSHDEAGMDALRQWAGALNTSWPYAVWCTRRKDTARDYLARGSLFCILKDGLPFAQVFIDKSGSGEIKDIYNRDFPIEHIMPVLNNKYFKAVLQTHGLRTKQAVYDKSKVISMLARAYNTFKKKSETVGLDEGTEEFDAKWAATHKKAYTVLCDAIQAEEKDPKQVQIIALIKAEVPKYDNLVTRLYEKIFSADPTIEFPEFLASYERFCEIIPVEQE